MTRGAIILTAWYAEIERLEANPDRSPEQNTRLDTLRRAVEYGERELVRIADLVGYVA